MHEITKSPETKKLERLTNNPDEALVPGKSLRWYGYKSKTDVKDFGMHRKQKRK